MSATTFWWIVIGFLVALYIFLIGKKIKKLEQDLKTLSITYSAAYNLITMETKRKEEHAKALKRLTDPESIADDMERGARLREMRDANRNVLPREDAGPPAKVYTPTMRARIPKGNYKRESPKD